MPTGRDPDEAISRLQYVTPHVLLTCSTHSGRLLLTDTRTKPATNTPPVQCTSSSDNVPPINKSEHWTFGCDDDNEVLIYKVSSSSDLHIHDLRSMDEPLKRCSLITGRYQDSASHLEVKVIVHCRLCLMNIHTFGCLHVTTLDLTIHWCFHEYTVV